MDSKKIKLTALGLFALLVTITVIGMKSLVNDVPVQIGPDYQANAVACVNKRVRAELNVTELPLNHADSWEDLATPEGGWLVTGPVTVVNSVGGQTETHYTCNVHFTSEDALNCNTKCVYLDPLQ